MRAETIAVVGLGHMGGAVALRLAAAGFDVVGYDNDAAARARRRDDGLAVADDLRAAIDGRAVVVTSLPNGDAVRAVWLGDAGVLALAAPDAILVELSTIDPASMSAVLDAAGDRAESLVDCPVSGSPDDARAGGLTLIVGGSPATIGRIEPILAALGSAWRHTGAVGTAKVVKIVNNMMSMGNVLVAAEAFAVGVAAGLDAHVLYEVLSVSGGRSHQFTKRFPKAIEGDVSPGFKMELGEKDLALGVELGRDVGIPTPTASVAHEMYAMAVARGFAGQDIVALLALYQRLKTDSRP